MKRMLLALLCGLSLCGCSSREDKANALIKDYMFKNLSDFNSYEVVETIVDSAYSIPYDQDLLASILALLVCVDNQNDEAKATLQLEEKIDFYYNEAAKYSYGVRQRLYDDIHEMEDDLHAQRKKYIKAIELKDFARGRVEDQLENMDNHLVGWAITHTFRCKDSDGKARLNTMVFSCDKNLKEIKSKMSKEENNKVHQIVELLLPGVKARKEGNIFRRNFYAKNNADSTASGIVYIIKDSGSTLRATSDKDTVKVNYSSTFIDGSTFDKREGISFPLNRVIKGWTEGLKLVGEGGKITLVLPPELAYGKQEVRGVKPYSTLIFDVDLLEVHPFVEGKNKK